MLISHVTVGLRNIVRNPLISSIKILSLSLGLSASILVMMYTNYIYNFDKSFPNWENIFRLVTSTNADFNSTAEPYAERLAIDYPQISSIVKVRPENGLFALESNSYQLPFFWVGNDVFELFSLEFVRGGETKLLRPNSLVLNESNARILFGNVDPIGKTVRFNGLADLVVSGIIRDVPENSYIDFSAMISIDTGKSIFGQNFMGGNGWISFGGTQTFFSLPSSSDRSLISDDLDKFLERHVPESSKSYANEVNLRLSIEPLADVYLSPRPGYNSGGSQRLAFFYGINALGLLILMTSCINFISLSISQIKSRTKEIDVRRTIGATKSQLITQFFVQSNMLTLASLITAIPVIYFATPVFESFTGTTLSLAALARSTYIIWIGAAIIVVACVCSILPTLVLSRSHHKLASAGGGIKGGRSATARSSITVIQFCLSNTFIILAIAAYILIDYLNNMELGYNKDSLVVVTTTYNPRIYGDFNYDAMANEMSQHPGILSLAKSSTAPPGSGFRNPWRRADWPSDRTVLLSHNPVDANYIETLQLDVIAGRGFLKEFPNEIVPEAGPVPEQVYGVVLTRGGVRELELGSVEEAVDSILTFQNRSFRVIGVVEDFRLSGGMEDSLTSIRALWATDQKLQYLVIRLDPTHIADALAHIEEVWERHRPSEIIDVTFFEETYNELIQERTTGIRVASLFSATVAIIIAFLGLFALSYYAAQRRTKEIGVRRVLGGTPESILKLLLIEFLRPVVVACLISTVIGYYAVDYLYSYFSSEPDFPLYIYLFISIATIFLAAIAVIGQCYKMANISPVHSLRYE